MKNGKSNLIAIFRGNAGIVLSMCVILLSFLLMLLSRYFDGFAQWYAVNVYPIFPETLGRIFSPWRFSVFEASILLLIISFIYTIIRLIWLFWFDRYRGRKYVAGLLKAVLYIFSVLLLTYTLTCSINYQRDNIGTVLKLPVEDVSTEKLETLCLILSKQLNDLTNDPEWRNSLRSLNDMSYIGTEAVNAMKSLGQNEPSLAGYYPQPKPIYSSKFLSMSGIEGIYSPFTMEANYNDDMTSFLVPYTMCHELAHLKGYMKEEDAGFIAYLASSNSPLPVYQYSGAFHALTFSLNALKNSVSVEKYYETYDKLPELVKIQLSYIGEQRREGPVIYRNIARYVNNAYLLANAQYQGSKSYGRMVDYLLAEYKELLEPDEML